MPLKKILLFFFSGYLLFFPVLAHASFTNFWQFSVKKEHDIIFSKNEKNFNITITFKPDHNLIIQCSLYQKNMDFNHQPNIILQLNHSLYKLYKSNTSYPYLYEATLTSIQAKDFFKKFITQENAYLFFSNQTIPLSLKGTTTIVNQAAKYIHTNPYETFFLPIPVLNLSFIHTKLFYLSIIFIIFLSLLNRRCRKILNNLFSKTIFIYRKKKAQRLAFAEIQKQQKMLAIKKEQLCFNDDYGTLIDDKWIKEIKRFINTTIRFILIKNHLGNMLPVIETNLIKKIKKLTKQPYIKKSSNINPNNLDPLEYEQYCARLLQQSGWDAKVTTASGDQGADVIAVKNQKKLILQCKLYKKPVGNKAVQEIIAAKQFYHADYAAVISNASYTISARQLANSTNIKLLHHDFLQEYAKTCY